jgi:hypothetical protein
MCAHRRNHQVGVLARELGLNVNVNEVEALFAGQLGTPRPQQPAQQLSLRVS